MNEHIQPQIGAYFPERAEFLSIEGLSLQLRRDDHARKTEFDSAAPELCSSSGSIERGNMSKSYEAAWEIEFGLSHAIVNQPTSCMVGLVEPCAAGQHGHINPSMVHHAQM